MLAAHAPGSQQVVLHALTLSNAKRDGASEWSLAPLAELCAELCGRPCSRQLVSVTLRQTLEPKGLASTFRSGRGLAVWAPTAEGRRLDAALAPLAKTDPATATRVLRRAKARPAAAAPPQSCGAALAAAPPAACACSRCGRALCCPDPACAEGEGAGAQDNS